MNTRLIKYNQAGFTIIELLITMTIVVILSMLVTPVMYARIQQVNVNIATQTLLQNAQYMEKWYGEHGYYGSSESSAECPALPYHFSPQSGSSQYVISGSGTSGNSCDGEGYSLIARPICGTSQANLGCVCLDQDSNIMQKANINCNNSGGLCDCIASSAIPNS